MQNSIKKFNFTEAQIAGLIAKQDTLNQYIHPQWHTQGFDWDLAIIDECMEIHGHLGWKWWKPSYQCGLTAANKSQVRLEVIDILHFLLSQWAEWEKTEPMTASLVELINGIELIEGDLYKQVTSMIRILTSRKGNPVLMWCLIALNVGLTEQEILETYTQKYVLNKFRQDHGYKTGEYVKEWEILTGSGPIVDGVGTEYTSKLMEDNEVLAIVVKNIGEEGQDTTDETILYKRLELAYNIRLNKG